MKTYIIPVIYQMYGKYKIEAENLEEAKLQVFTPEVGLPEDTSYIDNSMELDDYEVINDMNGIK